jgi:hypothetical protein
MSTSTAPYEVMAAQTFGRDAAMFQDLLGFMAQMSLTLWAMVLVTAVVRLVACHVLYRRPRFRAVRPTTPDRDEG